MRKTLRVTDAATAGNVNFNKKIVQADGINPFQVLYGMITITTDATAANRILTLQILDNSSNEVFRSEAGAPITASLTNQRILIHQGDLRETALANSTLIMPIPMDLIFFQDWTLRYSLAAGVAGDTFAVETLLAEI